MNIEVLHARQEGNEKQFRPHIRAHGQLVVVDVGFEGLKVCGHDAAQCSVCRWDQRLDDEDQESAPQF